MHFFRGVQHLVQESLLRGWRTLPIKEAIQGFWDLRDDRIDIGAFEYQESDIVPEVVQLCAEDDTPFEIDVIILEDSTGGAWEIGNNQTLFLAFPPGLTFQQTPDLEVAAIGEGLELVHYEINSEGIKIIYNRNYTTEPNKIEIKHIQLLSDLEPGYYNVFRAENGDAIQNGNNVLDSVSHVYFNVFPSITAQDLPYDDSFEGNSVSWQPGVDTSWWELGTPKGTHISSAFVGEKVWGIDLDGPYPANLHATLYSPCFDLTSLDRPVVAFSYWGDTEEALDGAVLQYSTDRGKTWEVVGTDTTGIDWYDFSDLNSNPGNQPVEKQYGWSGEESSWRRATHRLPDSFRTPNARFRMAFRSIEFVNPFKQLNGFAFDNFFVGDRSRKVLLEYFPDANARSLKEEIPDLYNKYHKDLLPIVYLNDGNDPLSKSNQIDPSARAGEYGISTQNSFVLGGNDFKGPIGHP